MRLKGRGGGEGRVTVNQQRWLSLAIVLPEVYFLGINNPFVGSDERPKSPSDFNNPFLDDLRAAAAASAVARGDKNPFDLPAQAEDSKSYLLFNYY